MPVDTGSSQDIARLTLQGWFVEVIVRKFFVKAIISLDIRKMSLSSRRRRLGCVFCLKPSDSRSSNETRRINYSVLRCRHGELLSRGDGDFIVIVGIISCK
jgi:hypothetical protein